MTHHAAYMSGDESYITSPDGKRLTSARVIMARVAGAATVGSPEEHLCLAVIDRAITDLCNPGAYTDKRDQQQAERFLASPALDAWCDAVSLDAQWVRETIVRLAHPNVARGLAPRKEAA